jgi:hypothetical protein
MYPCINFMLSTPCGMCIIFSLYPCMHVLQCHIIMIQKWLHYYNNTIMILCTLYNVIQIYADFYSKSDKPKLNLKQYRIRVDIGGGNYRYCYLDTRNNGVAYQTSSSPVTYMNLSCKIITFLIGTSSVIPEHVDLAIIPPNISVMQR